MPLFSRHLLAVALVAAYPVLALSAEPVDLPSSPSLPNQSPDTPAIAGSTIPGSLAPVTISVKRLDTARNGLSPTTGSSIYSFDQTDIEALPLGASTPLNQVLLQAPGVVQDSYGQLHVRGDHANMQYRIDGVVIPEPITGFGPAIDTRFASEINFLTGALPAQYGYRTAGIVDIKTKGLDAQPGGELGVVTGTNGHNEVNGSVGGSIGDVTYFLSGSWLENNLGIENTTGSVNAIHDHTDQGKGFGYLSYVIDGTSRVNLMMGSSSSRFQIPNLPGLQPQYTLANSGAISSDSLNANQREQNDFQILSFQRSNAGPLDYQVSLFHRRSTVDYSPDAAGDLIYNGIAGAIHRSNDAYGTQVDSSYRLNNAHTLRSGIFLQQEEMAINNNSLVFPADASGNQTSTTPISIQDNTAIKGYTYGLYLQDEWKASSNLTVNVGARFDSVNTVTNEQQLSPRIGLLYDWSSQTRLHAGYARYFTPPPTEKIDATSVALFQNTTNALPSDANTAVRAERSDYYDVGISHLLTPKLTIGVDAYYREVKNLQDEGQFGNALVYSAFNYEEGRIGGIEFTANYRDGNFGAYGNLARSEALARNVVTGQFHFDPNELAYISNNWVHMDHHQAWTGSGGMSYRYGPTTYSASMIFGSGLPRGFANTDNLPSYAQVNVAAARKVDLGSLGKFNTRISVLNLFDQSYELRDGTGIGVGAPQFGQRRTFYLSISRPFSF